MPARDLALLTSAVLAAGDIALQYWRTDQIVHHKGEGGPVSEGDFAVDRYLRDTLLAARPDYGWLSEETEDSDERLQHERAFVVDPIDGTRSYVEGGSTWAISAAVVEQGQPFAGVVFLPQREKLYTAGRGAGAMRDGAPIRQSGRATLDGAEVLASRAMFDAHHWPGGLPSLKREFRPSLAYRLCLVAEGRFDAMLTVRPTWEWDIAAGVLIAEEAGAIASDATGRPLRFNQPHPQSAGAVVATPAVHGGLLAHLAPQDLPA